MVVGEFNSGKSAFINALLGQRVLEEGVTPTTAEIHLLKHGPELRIEPAAPGLRTVTAPVEMLATSTSWTRPAPTPSSASTRT